MLKLEFPNIGHKEVYEKLKKEWWDVEKIPTSPSILFEWNNYKEFLKWVEDDVLGLNWWIKGHLFFLVDDETNEILWWVQIRHTIEHPNLFENWWHIWYGIAPKFRRKWYATKMLELALLKLKELLLNLDKVLITCDIDNIWSSKVIEKNWGVFERITEIWKKRYWVDVK